MKAVKKKIATGVALIMVLSIVLLTVILHFRQTVTANESFDGIEAIIKGNTESNPFRIAELVPDKSMAELGFMIDGQEPVNWLSELAKYKTTNAREAFVKDLRNQLSAITAEDSTKALKFSKYEESYVLPSEDFASWARIDLASEETVERGTSGYSLSDVGIGNGEYDDSYTYSPVNDKSGNYDENVDYYLAGPNTYYNVAFEGVDSSMFRTDDEGKYVCTDDKLKLYYVDTRAETAITSQELLDELIGSANLNTYLYKKNTSNMSGAYTLVTKSDGSPMKLKDVSSYDNLMGIDNEHIYYTVEFTYWGDKALNSSTVYYAVSGTPVFCSDKTGLYGAVKDKDTPYIESGTGNFVQTDEMCCIYVGEGKGKYKLVIGGSLSKDVKVDHIFYRGGFSNNNLFRNGVFGQDSYFTKTDNSVMYFNVDTIVPAEFDYNSASRNDLIYISATSSIYGSSTSFSAENDISWEVLKNVISLVQNGKPVIVDFSIVGQARSDLANASNLKKLVAILAGNQVNTVKLTDDIRYSTEFWDDIVNSISSDADMHFVNGNIYVYPGNTYDSSSKNVPYIFDNFSKKLVVASDTTDFEAKAKEAGFLEIASFINNQNLSRKTENDALGNEAYGYFDLLIDGAIVIEYIICNSTMEITEVRESINVLDIEPCYVDDSVKDMNAIQAADILSWFNKKDYNIKEVNLTHMSSAEFIGKTEDLSKYDMIYFGLSRNMFYREGNEYSNTVYNDSLMNGLIYSNIGDICVLSPKQTEYRNNNHSGLLDSDYLTNGIYRLSVKALDDESYSDKVGADKFRNAPNTYRYSGNDLTMDKVNAIKDYIKAGYPVVVNENFYNNGKVFDYYIDNCSNIYALMDEIYTIPNVLLRSDVKQDSRELYGYLSLGKPKINLSSPILPEEVADEDIDDSYNNSYIRLEDNKLTYEFTISNKGSADQSSTFDIKLYLDANSDGKFSKTQEEISASELKLYDSGDFISPVSYVDEEENASYKYEILAGPKHYYRLEYTLPDGYIGLIPWKLVVSQSSNNYRYDTVLGYSYRQRTGEKETIKVLQINQVSNSTYAKSTFNMQEQLQDTSSKFYKLMQKVEDFNIDITSVGSDVYVNTYTPGCLDEYDMLIIGFADMYQIKDETPGKQAVNGIKEYINDGKPVLFAHDTTSYFNDSTQPWNWGYDFNSQIRDIVGLDRYGILTSEALRKGNMLYKGSDDYNTVIEEANESGKDVAYLPRTNKSVIVKQSQGFSNADLMRFVAYTNADETNGSKYNKYWPIKTSSNELKYYTTAKVEQVNSGQITTYPFVIKKNFVCSVTHGQYYQIDMNEDADKDGESDIVVWYTLASCWDKNIGVYNTTFDKTARDVRNNYYIYTKGNVTYSGVGHRSIADNEDELKLYINTMVAAYNSGVHAPRITLTEGSDIGSDEIDSIYVSFEQSMNMDAIEDDIYTSESDSESVEQQVQDELADEDASNQINKVASKSVYFTVTDTNIVRNLKRKEIRVQFGIMDDVTEEQYLADKDSYISVAIDGKQTYLRKIDLAVYQLDGDPQITYLNSGMTYRVEIPLNLLGEDDNMVELYAVAQTTIVKNRTDKTETREETGFSYDKLTIQRLGLSDLD